jgi:glycosyltransferase involved in cell wall biosynthesis
MADTKEKIGILSTFGFSTNSAAFLARLVLVESSIASQVHVIAPDMSWKNLDNVIFYKVNYKVEKNALKQIIGQISSQIEMAIKLAKVSKKIEYWIFFGGDFLLLPAIVAKLLRVKVFLSLAGNLEKEAELKRNILNKPQLIMKRMVFAMSDRIILFSGILVEQWKMQRYKKKISIADDHFVDLNVYKIKESLSQRKELVGYIGRFSSEKGILNFVSAVPKVIQKRPGTNFIIVGNGPLQEKVEEYIYKEKIEDYITLVDRIPHELVPSYLNQLRLCVLPSYTEGMPNIVIEAMACGTPVLATPVGAVPDLIKDGITGFIMENNTPECVADNICRALDYNNLDLMAQTARQFIEQHFTFETARHSYHQVSLVLSKKTNN